MRIFSGAAGPETVNVTTVPSLDTCPPDTWPTGPQNVGSRHIGPRDVRLTSTLSMREVPSGSKSIALT